MQQRSLVLQHCLTFRWWNAGSGRWWLVVPKYRWSACSGTKSEPRHPAVWGFLLHRWVLACFGWLLMIWDNRHSSCLMHASSVCHTSLHVQKDLQITWLASDLTDIREWWCRALCHWRHQPCVPSVSGDLSTVEGQDTRRWKSCPGCIGCSDHHEYDAKEMSMAVTHV